MDTSDCDVIRHPRSIIHIDMDCFYAQVEMARHPEYDGRPLGVQQKTMVVTTNYLAREFGVKKWTPVKEALRLCPEMVLVNGEDMTNYKQASVKIGEILHQFTPLVERLCLDEAYVDVSAIVEKYMNSDRSTTENEELMPDQREKLKEETPVGHVFAEVSEDCPCGCHSRLVAATKIAAEMRSKIFKELKLTSSAGIAHNKLLAKLAGTLNKPNDQTLVYPCTASMVMSSLGSASKIFGVGQKTYELLEKNDISTVDDLRSTPLDVLEAKIGKDLARKLKDSAEGIDETIVKPSGKPQTIGLEEGLKSVSLVSDVESRLGALLRRLTEMTNEDGRIPLAVKVTVRKHEYKKANSGKRETRQCALPRHLLPTSKGVYDHAKLLALVMKLFHRAVDITKPFHLTLLGVAFTKFEERSSGRSSIASFLRKQVAVQSVLDISSEEGISDVSLGSPMSINQDSNDSAELSNLTNCSLSGSNGCATYSCTDDDDISNEVEPSPKKTKLEFWLSGRKESPSNEMAGLRLGSPSPIPTSPTVLKSLPVDLQREMRSPWPAANKPKPNNILKYFIANK